MEPLLILLVIPFIAFMMLRADSLRRNGLDPQTRESARKSLPIYSIAVWLIGGLFLYLGLQDAFTQKLNYEVVIASFARLGVGVGLSYLGWKFWQVSHYVPQDDLPLQDVVRRDVQAYSARTAAILFVFLPLALPSLVLLALFGFIPIISYQFASYPQRFIQNQLLWTLALAARNKLDLGTEVGNLANTLDAERYTTRAVVLKVLSGIACISMPLLLIFFIPIMFRIRSRNKLIQQLTSLSSSLHDGVPLARALSYHQNLLPTELVGAMESSTDSGDLASILGKTAIDHSKKLESSSFGGNLSEASVFYFVFVFSVLFQVTGFIMYWIVPKFKEIFLDFGVELPAITELVINTSDLVAAYWYLLGPLLVIPLLPFVGAIFISFEQSKWVPAFLLRMFPRIESPQLLRRLGYVADQQMPLQPSLASLANATPDLARSRRFERLENRIDLGDTLGQALNDEGFVNSREAYSINHAAETGHLGWALTSIADSIQQRRLNRSNWAMEFVRPFMIIFLAVLVGIFSIGMFMPLVKLLNDLS